MARKKEFSKRILVGLKPWISDSLDDFIASDRNAFKSYSEVINYALTSFLRPTDSWCPDKRK